MRLKSLLALAGAVVALGLASPQPAEAYDWDRHRRPAGWDHVRTVRHWTYYPRYQHVFLAAERTDPYAYSYQPNGYYPYYNSGDWRPVRDVDRRRPTLIAPVYYPAWGYNKKHWHNAKWHWKHHGRIDHGHW